jgi:hypothetical protein
LFTKGLSLLCNGVPPFFHSSYGAWKIRKFLLFGYRVLINLTKILHQCSMTPLETINANDDIRERGCQEFNYVVKIVHATIQILSILSKLLLMLPLI